MVTLQFLEPFFWNFEDWLKFNNRGIRPIIYRIGDEWYRV